MKPIPLITAAMMACSLAPSEAQPLSKWMAIGNSITRHGAKEDIGWRGEPRGMAASEPFKDYVSLLTQKLQAADAQNAREVKVVGRLGKLSGGTIEQVNTVLDELKNWNADLVTIQLGENDSFKAITPDEFEKRYRLLVEAVLSAKNRPTVVCTGVWLPGTPMNDSSTAYREGTDGYTKDQIIEKLCREYGLRFARIAPIAADPANRGDGESDGVRWHPNDRGMKGYVDAIFSALEGAKE